MKKIIICCCTLFFFVFISCKKDNINVNDPLSGTSWNFISQTTQTEVTQEEKSSGDDIKIHSVMDYTSTDNYGSFSFYQGKSTPNNISYSVSTPLYGTTYHNGILSETDTFPFSTSTSQAGIMSSYKILGSDSVFFQKAFITSPYATGEDVYPPTPNGYKFYITGNTLTMTSFFSIDSTENLGGTTIHVHEMANTSITLTKQ